MVTFMLFEHHMATNDESDESEDDVPAEAAEVMKKLFGQMGQA